MASKVLLAAVLAVSQVAHCSPVGPPAPYPVEAYPDIAPNYNYQFGVNDKDYSGAVFSHQENRADYNTQGEYRVNLPDGRVQIVTYTAGPEGYIADVTYEGEAVYADAPAYKPAPAPYKPAPAPTYKPAPAPAPVVKVAAPVYPAPVVKVAPVVPVVKVAPAPYHPAPAVYHPKPVVAAPVYHPKVYHPAPAYHPAPKKYGYTVVTTAAPAPAEPEVKAAEPEVVEEEAPVEAEASSYEAPAAPAAEAAAEAERYRYYRY